MSCKYCSRVVYLGYFRNGAQCVCCKTAAHRSCVPIGNEILHKDLWQCDRCCEHQLIENISKRIVRDVNQLPNTDESSGKLNPLSNLQTRICNNLNVLKRRFDAGLDKNKQVFTEIERGVEDVSRELEDVRKELEAIQGKFGGISLKEEHAQMGHESTGSNANSNEDMSRCEEKRESVKRPFSLVSCDEEKKKRSKILK